MTPRNSETVAGLLVRWRATWGSSAPVSHELRWDWPDEVVRFHSLPNHERLAETDAEKAEIWQRFHALYTALVALNHSKRLFVLVLGRSQRREGLGKLKAVLARGRYLSTWSDGEDQDSFKYYVWLHEGPFSADTLRALSGAAADDTSAVLFTDESCSWCLSPYDGGFDILAQSAEDRDLLRVSFSEWLPLPDDPYGLNS
jgi:hypothetical protein